MGTETATSDRAAWIKGPACHCNPPAKTQSGRGGWCCWAPGVGKGTQAELLHQQLGACPLSTGDVFRAAKATAEPIAARRSPRPWSTCARANVPDDDRADMVRERKNASAVPAGSCSMVFRGPLPRPRPWPPCSSNWA